MSFYIEIRGSWNLTADELWPDGAPENPTDDDARREVEKAGSITQLIQDWNLEPDEVWVAHKLADLS